MRTSFLGAWGRRRPPLVPADVLGGVMGAPVPRRQKIFSGRVGSGRRAGKQPSRSLFPHPRPASLMQPWAKAKFNAQGVASRSGSVFLESWPTAGRCPARGPFHQITPREDRAERPPRSSLLLNESRTSRKPYMTNGRTPEKSPNPSLVGAIPIGRWEGTTLCHRHGPFQRQNVGRFLDGSSAHGRAWQKTRASATTDRHEHDAASTPPSTIRRPSRQPSTVKMFFT